MKSCVVSDALRRTSIQATFLSMVTGRSQFGLVPGPTSATGGRGRLVMAAQLTLKQLHQCLTPIRGQTRLAQRVRSRARPTHPRHLLPSRSATCASAVGRG